MAEIVLTLTALARIERLGDSHRYELVLDDGANQVRLPLAAATDDEPFPHQAVEAFGWRIIGTATDARRLALDYLPQVAT